MDGAPAGTPEARSGAWTGACAGLKNSTGALGGARQLRGESNATATYHDPPVAATPAMRTVSPARRPLRFAHRLAVLVVLACRRAGRRWPRRGLAGDQRGRSARPSGGAPTVSGAQEWPKSPHDPPARGR